MLSLIQDLDPRRQSYRTYIVSTGDSFSSSKAVEFEANLAKRHGLKFRPANIDPGEKSESDEGSFEIVTVPRARKIHQPLWSTPLSSLSCLWACIKVLGKNGRCESVNGGSPDVILTNGPATGVIVVLAALILQFSGLKGQGELKTIYVESWARVKTLSLSGKILSLGLTDRFLVQWEGLKRGRAEYQGALLH
jgi:beta-1,4-N-acetylglucosaminyltransferase